MSYESQLKVGKRIRPALRETGCWTYTNGIYTMQTTRSNGEPVDIEDPIYRNRYRVERVDGIAIHDGVGELHGVLQHLVLELEGADLWPELLLLLLRKAGALALLLCLTLVLVAHLLEELQLLAGRLVFHLLVAVHTVERRVDHRLTGSALRAGVPGSLDGSRTELALAADHGRRGRHGELRVEVDGCLEERVSEEVPRIHEAVHPQAAER